MYTHRESHRRSAFLAFAACLFLSALAVPVASAQVDDKKAEVVRTWHADLGQLAPEFELRDTGGNTWRLSEHRGRVVVLEWYNPLCPVVGRAHARGGPLDTLGNKCRGEDIEWVAINSGARGMQGSGVKVNEAGRREMKLEYPILLDEAGWVGRMYGAMSTPHLYIIDQKGVLVYTGGHEDRVGNNLVQGALRELAETGEIETPRTKAFGCGVKYARYVKVGLVAPDFVLESLNGREHRLSSMRGNYVVLEWFNPSCPEVAEAHAAGGSLAGLAARLDSERVRWFAINSGAPGKPGTSNEEMRAAALGWGLEHPILRDESGKVGKAFAARRTPEMFVIDRRGVIIYTGAPAPRGGGVNYVQQALEESWAGLPISVPKTKTHGGDIRYER